MEIIIEETVRGVINENILLLKHQNQAKNSSIK